MRRASFGANAAGLRDGYPRWFMPSDAPEGRLPVLRHPDLRRYLSARFIVSVATQVQTVAVGWQVFSVSGDPFDLGLVALSQFLPFIVLILPAGHVADRYDRRRVQLLTYALLAACAVILLALALARVTDLLPVFAVMVLFGIARAFNQPTAQALLPNLAPIELFPRAVAVNSSLGQVATIAGPALGGALVLLGVEVAYGLSVVLLIAGTLTVATLRGGGRGDALREPVSWSALLSGVNFVRSRPIVLGSISLDLFAVLFGGATALLPIYAGDILDVGPVGLGAMRAAPAVGAALLAAVVAVRPIRRAVGRWMFGGVAAFGVATIVFGLSTSLVLSLDCAGRHGGRRHGERLHPPPARPARDAGRDPRAGERGECGLHRRLERARRVRVRHHRRLVGRGAGRGGRWGGNPAWSAWRGRGSSRSSGGSTGSPAPPRRLRTRRRAPHRR